MRKAGVNASAFFVPQNFRYMTEFKQGYIAGHNALMNEIKSRCREMLNAGEGDSTSADNSFVLDIFYLLASINQPTHE